MLLSGAEIKARAMLQDTDNGSFREASYDLRIGTIIPIKTREEVKAFNLPFQGMVEVISKEKCNLPVNVAGYAAVKTSLCDRGILALNIGIIDPGYRGPLSSVLINFGKGDVHIQEDDIFLRLAFHEFAAQAGAAPQPNVELKSYIREKIKTIEAHFGETFLNISDALFDSVFQRWIKILLIYLPIGALILALLSLFITLGSTWGGRFTLSKDDVRTNLRTEVVDELRQKYITSLEHRLSALESQSQLPAHPQPLPPKPRQKQSAPKTGTP